jgi:hypothetical protein
LIRCWVPSIQNDLNSSKLLNKRSQPKNSGAILDPYQKFIHVGKREGRAIGGPKMKHLPKRRKYNN